MGLDQATGQNISPLWACIKTGGALTFLIGLYYLGLNFLKKRDIRLPWIQKNGKTNKQSIQIVETKYLGGKSHVCLIEANSCTLLLGVSPQGITCLKDFSTPKSPGKNFEEHLAQQSL